MITSIEQANEEFFKIFYGLEIPCKKKGNFKPVVSYANLSSYDYTEDSGQSYPCIILSDFTPTLKPEWWVELRETYGGVSLDGLSGYLMRNPVWMSFKYDVGTFCKSYYENIAMRDYFLAKFMTEERFIFNSRLSGELEVGDIVPYTMEETKVERTDGIFEENYSFDLSVWVYPHTPKEVNDIVEAINVNLIRADYGE